MLGKCWKNAHRLTHSKNRSELVYTCVRPKSCLVLVTRRHHLHQFLNGSVPEHFPKSSRSVELGLPCRRRRRCRGEHLYSIVRYHECFDGDIRLEPNVEYARAFLEAPYPLKRTY